MLLYTYVCVYIIYCFANIIWQLPWIPQKLSFTVSTVLSWKLLWDGSDRGRVARDLFTKWFVPSKISRKTWDTFRSLRQMWPQDSAEMIQDSWQFQHIMYFIKDQVRFLLLIGSNDQTHLIDPNSLWDLNYHDCFDSLVRFWLPFTMIYNRHSGTTISIMISSRSGLQWTSMDLFPQTTSFPVAKVGQFFAFRNIYKPTNVLSMLGEFHVSFSGGVYDCRHVSPTFFHICSQSNCCTKVSTRWR